MKVIPVGRVSVNGFQLCEQFCLLTAVHRGLSARGRWQPESHLDEMLTDLDEERKGL